MHLATMRACSAVTLAMLAMACGSPTAPADSAPPLALPPGLSLVLTRLYERLPGFLETQALGEEAALPLNPRIAHLIQQQIALLREPKLAQRILDARLDVERQVASIDGGTISIGALFPREAMRDDARAAIDAVAATVTVLEEFLDIPYQDLVGCIQVWYGFSTGDSGSQGNIVIADRHLDRTTGLIDPVVLPHEAVIAHELGHAYYSNESLAQFLEMYAYNAPRFGTEVARWSHTRRYVPLDPGNVDSAAILDIYTLLGPERMRRALQRIDAMPVRYGEPLTGEARQALVDEAPEDVRAVVAEKAARVRM